MLAKYFMCTSCSPLLVGLWNSHFHFREYSTRGRASGTRRQSRRCDLEILEVSYCDILWADMHMEFLWSNLWPWGLSTDNGNNPDTWRTIHDCTGYLAFMPNEQQKRKADVGKPYPFFWMVWRNIQVMISA